MEELFRSSRRAIVWLVEASLLSLLCMFACGLTLGWARALDLEQVLRALLIVAVAQASMYYHGLYAARPLPTSTLVLGLVRSLLAAAGVLWLLSHLTPQRVFGRGVLTVSLGAAAVILPVWRTVWQRIMGSASFQRRALILGAGPLARACAALIVEGQASGFRLAGVLASEAERPPPGLEMAGGYGDLARVVEERGVEHLIVACEERRGRLPVVELLELKLRGVHVEEGVDFYERESGRIFVTAIKPSDLLFAEGFHLRRGAQRVKRAFDLLGASVGLVLASPLLLLAAIAVRLDSPGPILYSQIRVGAFGRTFRIFKLRTMRTDAEAQGAVWAQADDPRVTRVGRLLRRSRVDELPQLWNVLVGEMSLVGPRPERPVFIERLEQEIPFFRQRLCVKPGITGHAQVRCRYGASVEDAREKLQYDLFYIKSFSFWFDLSILLDTVKVVLLRIGSR